MSTVGDIDLAKNWHGLQFQITIRKEAKKKRGKKESELGERGREGEEKGKTKGRMQRWKEKEAGKSMMWEWR